MTQLLFLLMRTSSKKCVYPGSKVAEDKHFSAVEDFAVLSLGYCKQILKKAFVSIFLYFKN